MHTATTIFAPNIDVVGDVAYVLGRPGNGDVDQLCEDRDEFGVRQYKINKWAKYKPVISSIIDTKVQMDPSTYRWLNTATWWRGQSGRCGFESIEVFGAMGDPFSPSGQSFAYKLYNLQLPWVYSPPTGANPSRVLDFSQYDSDSIQPFVRPTQTEIPVQSGTITIPFDLPVLGPDNLALTDLVIAEVDPNKTLAQWYFGGLFVNGDQFVVALSSGPVGGSSLQIVITDSQKVSMLQGKSWEFVPFFAENSSDPQQAGNHLISMDNQSRVSIKFMVPGYNLFVFATGMWNQAGTQISWEVSVVHSTSGTISCGTAYLAIYDGDPDGSTPVNDIAHTNVYIGDVQGNSSVTRTGTINCTKTSVQYYIKCALPSGLVYTSAASQIEDYDAPEPMQ